ncbi:hypothetical protein [Reinekea sp. G2M2-21]|uniref:hypothetical protein n=1 Tax=Reinekea sp. G2M2-21 TaxID=2788942 RepID=UPI0018A98C75|nr:hypothetical protein [Reinekea sp. G2M2-21]
MGIASFFENIFSSSINPAASDFVSLLAPVRSHVKYGGEPIRLKLDEEHAFLAMDGSLVSFVEWQGMFGCLKDRRKENAIHAISKALDLMHAEKGGVLEWTIDNPSDDVERLANGQYERARNLAFKKGIDVEAFVSSEIETIAPMLRPRRQVMAIWTPKNRLSRGQQERFEQVFTQILAEQSKMMPKNAHELSSTFIQNSVALSQELEMIHDTRVAQIMDVFSDQEACVKLLNWEEALKNVKEMAHPGLRGSEYKPFLAGSSVAPRTFDLKSGKIDVSSIAPVSIGWQIFSEEPIPEKDAVYYDGYWHVPKVMALGPDVISSMEDIIEKLPLTLPWRMRVIAAPLFVTDSFNASIAYMAAALPGETNKKIRDSVKELETRMSGDSCQYSIQVIFDTWSKSLDQARANMSDLQQTFLTHGSPALTGNTSDLRALFIATLPGLNLVPPAPKHFMSTREVAQFFGGGFPANLMKHGSETFISEGQMMNVGLFQPELEKYIGAIIGASGAGKSLLLNSSNLFRMITMGKTLPYILLLDINASGRSVADFIIKKSLGRYEHEVIFHRFSADRHGAVNPLDNRLGQTKPLQTDLTKLANFLTLYVQASAQIQEPVGMRDMIIQILEHAYYAKAQPETAERYKPGIEPRVDSVLAQYPQFAELVESKLFLTWFEVVDFLGSKHEYETAGLANIYTSPLIPELPSLFKENQPLYKRYNTDATRHLIEQFERQISINKSRFPCFSYRTKKSFDNARVVMFDLIDVAPSEDYAMGRMFYSLAMYIGAKNYVLANRDIKDTVLESFRPIFRSHWRERIRDLRGTPKLIQGDEIHRTGKPEIIIDGKTISNPTWQIFETFAAELRKSYGGMLLASQEPGHFSSTYLGTHCSCVYMGGNWKPDQIKKAEDLLGLDADETTALVEYVHGVKPGQGSKWLVKAEVKAKWQSFVGEYRKGPDAIWMLSTSTEDFMLVESLTERVGDDELARKILHKRFPKGSAKDWIEDMREKLASTNQESDDIYSYAANQILDGYKQGIDALIA